ncbi:hypothetical protein ACO2RV_04635 [Ancylobacter sp. VNQ12]|uniref:TSCPD domain-containing protein n=1 Tax=Ancylobacter sp. VNQ12 TaxID=3400920 RepID=UPI003C100D75
MTREFLPSRRAAASFDFLVGGICYTATLGYFDDGRVGEVFVDGPKSGSDAETNGSDAAAILSVALQYGVPPEAFTRSMQRDSEGRPLGPIGVVVDLLVARGEG